MVSKKSLGEPFNLTIIILIIATVTLLLIIALIKTGLLKTPGFLSEYIFKPAGLE